MCVCVWGGGAPPFTRTFLFDFLWDCDNLNVFKTAGGQRCPCHCLRQRNWLACGKDIDQGRLIYKRANSCDCPLFRQDPLGSFMSAVVIFEFQVWPRAKPSTPIICFFISDLVIPFWNFKSRSHWLETKRSKIWWTNQDCMRYPVFQVCAFVRTTTLDKG